MYAGVRGALAVIGLLVVYAIVRWYFIYSAL